MISAQDNGMRTDGKNLLVVIPTYNEAENIGIVVGRVLGANDKTEILIVDDNSPDGTAGIVSGMAESDPRIHLLTREKKAGLGTAYVVGFKYAIDHGYKFVMEMDADLSHDPGEIPRFLEALGKADVAVGSRYSDGVSVLNWPIKRLLLSYGANIFARTVTGVPVNDMTSGFKVFKIEVLEAIDLNSIRSNGYAFQVEMNVRAHHKGFKIVEVPIIFTERRFGSSKMSKKIVFEAVRIVLMLGFARTLRALGIK